MTPHRTTLHGVTRSRERLGIPTRAVLRLANRAFEHGIAAEETRGNLRHWCCGRVDPSKAQLLRLYGEHCFIFAESRLVTVYAVPWALRAELARARAEHDESRGELT